MNEWEETLEDRYYDWPLFTRILRYLRPYGKLVVLSVFLLLAVSLLNLAGPYLTKIAIDDHIKVGDYAGLDRIALIYIVVLVTAFVCQFFQYYTIQFIGQRVMYDLRTQVFGHLHKMSFKFFDRNPIGKMITRTVNDIEVLNEMLTSGLILVFSDLFTLVGIFFMLAYLDWRLMLVVCAVFPFLYLATNAYRTRARDALRKNRAHVTKLNTLLEENLSGMNTVQMFNQEDNRYREFTGVSRSKLSEDLRSLFYNSVYLPSIDVFSAIGMGLVIWYGGGRFVQNEVELGVLVAFMQYLHKFFEPIRDLAEKFNIIQTAMASSERIFELLDTPEDMQNPAQPKPLPKIEGRVEFENVWFAYKNEDYVLQDVSFALEPGESLAIVGATGSGKTTIVNTLYRFYDIQKGAIRVDGASLAEVDKYALRSQMALVQQDVFLFARNILENIRLGNTDLGVEEIESIAHAVNSHHFIENLPHKYEQPLMEGGNSLSLGQKQLLSFARALAFNPRILILDEATSNVDTETEKKIQDAMQKLIRGRTSIIIAHRLSTLQHVDKVLVLRHGRVVEFGTRQELIKQRGTYYNLLKLQSDLTKGP
ncbi:ABC transporter ATP-binding protein [Nitrospina watsonii]|uniref:ABC transporter ATP-binding protein n=1 Tax=Nitrospina watsonii TaxID=1323948 RepID=A0ABM9HFD7_9BACT|nr:ABC transporter ATP-binding protein [Nitrospina watsonii]CAI2718747.1 ABC transporter ATP-binding protein [Nitrospina watsonii]